MMSLRFLLLVILHAASLEALSFASYYASHMVLQRAPREATVWGFADSDYLGQEVTVSLINQMGRSIVLKTSIREGPPGSRSPKESMVWSVLLPATPAGGPFTLRVSLDTLKVEISDIFFGDVWLCSGQSNMEMPLWQTLNSTNEILAAESYPNIRLYTVARMASVTPLYDFTQVALQWARPTAATVRRFSSLCWSYGRKLHEHMKGVPIGLVASSFGGTRIEAWSSREALAKCEGLGQRSKQPTTLWNGMIHPLLNMTITGAIWYQGEANAGRGDYDCKFKEMIRDWRLRFSAASSKQTDGLFPFGFVQLSAIRKGPRIGGFPSLRWQQTARRGSAPNADLPNTFMAVAMDLPDFQSPHGPIHPRDKTTISSRLLRGVRAVFLGEKEVIHQGPLPTSYKYLPRRSTLQLQFSGGALEMRTNAGFEVCCSEAEDAGCELENDARWVAAPIVNLSGTTLTLSTNQCPFPYIRAHRYAWRTSPCEYKGCAVYLQGEELPAPPYIKNGLLQNDGKWHRIQF